MIRPTPTSTTAVLLVACVVALALAAAGCTEPGDPGSLHPNRTPESRLSNVPPPGTTSTSPLVTLSWLGDDADGFVVGYRYTWSFQASESSPIEKKPYTYILNIMIGGLALVMDGNEAQAPVVYKFFSTLPPEGLDTTRLNALARGDTLLFEGVPVWASNPDGVRYPTHESPSQGTFIFDSQDSLNPHVFEVSAIDNLGALDPTPAMVDFTTPQVPPPDVEIVDGPGNLNRQTHTYSDTVLVLNRVTDTFTGIEFGFQGYDPNSRTIEYSWIIDRDEWPPDSVEARWSPFSLTNRARITSADMPDSSRTSHRIYVRGRNEFGSISTRGYFTRPSTDSLGNPTQDTTWAYANFSTIYPPFATVPSAPKRILIIDNTYSWDTLATPPLRPSRTDLMQYYSGLYDELGLAGQYDVYHVPYTPSLSGTWPGLGVIGQYSLVHVVCDVTNDFNRFPSISPGHQGKIIEYCNVGGKVLINGWNVTRADNLPASSTFLNNILHITRQTSVPIPEFAGAHHATLPDLEQYTDVHVDSAKLDPAWGGAMPAMPYYQAYGFGEIIYRYDALHDNALIQVGPGQFSLIEGNAVGIRYIGLTYDVIFHGFPLYYIERPAALEVLRKSLKDLKHL